MLRRIQTFGPHLHPRRHRLLVPSEELPVPTYLQSPTEEGRVKVAFWDAADAGKGLTQVMHDAVDA